MSKANKTPSTLNIEEKHRNCQNCYRIELSSNRNYKWNIAHFCFLKQDRFPRDLATDGGHLRRPLKQHQQAEVQRDYEQPGQQREHRRKEF